MRSYFSFRSLLVIAALAVCGVLAMVAGSSALHTVSPPFTQASLQTSGTAGRSSSWLPQFWAFEASGDNLGNGNASPNIFLYDHVLRVLGGVPGIRQITCGDSNAIHPSIARFNNRIAFEADGGLCGDPRVNCDAFATPTAGRQVFVWDDETGLIQQVTNCPGNCTSPNLSGNGQMIVFESDVSLIGATLGMLLAKPELYQANLRGIGLRTHCNQYPCGGAAPSLGLRRLTFTGGRNAVQSGNGRLVFFQSDGDPIHNGASPGIDHVYLLAMPRDPFLPITPNLYTQISTGMFAARNPTTNSGGRIISFEQDMPYNGVGPIVTQVMLFKHNPKKNMPAFQVTNGTLNSFNPSISPDGRHLAFVSAGDLMGFGYPGNQIYHYHTGRRKLQQLTAGFNGGQYPSTTIGVFVGFSSADDFLGNGNTTQEFWVANSYRGGPAGFPFPPPGTATPRPSATPSVTPTPFAGIPDNISLALLTEEAADNGDNTLTTVIAATVSDAVGNPVPDGTFVHFEVAFPTGGVVVSNGRTNTDPDCDVSRFEEKTGVHIINRTSVAHVCVTYPAGVAGSTRNIIGKAGPSVCVDGGTPFAPCNSVGECAPAFYCSNSISTTCDPIANGNTQCPPGGLCQEHPATACDNTAVSQDTLKLPLPHNDCTLNAQPCSDFNPCTVGDVCAGGLPDKVCVGGTNNGQPCTLDAQCPQSRRCFGGANHGNACNNQFDCPPLAAGGPPGECRLQETGACQLTTPPTCQPGPTTTCPDDGNACTIDVCNFYTGKCGVPPECPDDKNSCTDDVCNPTDGTCGIANAAPCEDGNPCTTSDVCADGICQPGPVITCPDDLNNCTLDECNPSNGKCGIRLDPCACSAP